MSDRFQELGPEAPTLCTGWTTRDLAAHLVLRERRLDAAAGILLRPLAGYTGKVQRDIAAQPWEELVRQVRTGPPRWSPLGWPVAAEYGNAAEYFVHHEDIRRAQPDWRPRPPDATRDAMFWRSLRTLARLAYRGSPVGVLLQRPDGTALTGKRGPSTVIISGEVGELLLHAFGRDEVRLDFEGDPEAVASVRELRRSF